MELRVQSCRGFLSSIHMGIAEKVYRYKGEWYPEIWSMVQKYLREHCGIPMPVHSSSIRVMVEHNGHGHLWGIILIENKWNPFYPYRLVGHFGHEPWIGRPLSERHLEREYISPIIHRLEHIQKRQSAWEKYMLVGTAMFSLGAVLASALLGGPILIPCVYGCLATVCAWRFVPSWITRKEFHEHLSERSRREYHQKYYALKWQNEVEVVE